MSDATPVSYTHLRAHETRMFISYAVFCFKKFFLMIRRPPRSTPYTVRRQRQMCIRDRAMLRLKAFNVATSLIRSLIALVAIVAFCLALRWLR